MEETNEMNDLPTDDQFLQQIYAAYRDESYIEDFERIYQEGFDLEGLFAKRVAEGRFQPNEIEKFRALIEETFSLEVAFRGQLIDSLKKMALTLVGSDREQLVGIPVGLLPSSELNACAIATPRRGAVIILNHGVISRLALVCRCAVSFMSWHTDTPFCRDAPQRAYAEALIGLALYTVTEDVSHLVPHKLTLSFPSLPDYDDTTISFCQLMELFILLHEYGHITCGHLNYADLRPAFGGRLLGLHEYRKSELQEFEADQYAVKQLLSWGVARGLPQSDFAFGAGLLMKFFELCESAVQGTPHLAARTHPPARDRWEQIKKHTNLADATGAFALNLDAAFEVVKGGLQRK